MEFCVSIHAPMKGATSISSNFFLALIVSIHAPMKGATRISVMDIIRIIVSIHAPMKGATIPSFSFFLSKMFQSTHP